MRPILLPPPIPGLRPSQSARNLLYRRLQLGYPDVVHSGTSLHLSSGWAWIGVEIVELLVKEIPAEERMRVLPLSHLDFWHFDEGPSLGMKAPCRVADAIAEHAHIRAESTCEICGAAGELYSRPSLNVRSHVLCPLCFLMNGESLRLVDDEKSD